MQLSHTRMVISDEKLFEETGADCLQGHPDT